VNKLLAGIAALPFLSSVAFAAQPLSEHQMDQVTAGFGAFATGAANASGGVITTTTATVAELAGYATVQVMSPNPGGTGSVISKVLTVYKAVAGSTSSSASSSLTAGTPLPGFSP